MASTNQSPFYQKAEQEYLEATSDEERIACLEIMIKECPKHKSSENMLRNLTNRLKKLKEGVERQRKSSKGSRSGLKKGDVQCVLLGFPNTGKTSLFNRLTGLDEVVSSHPFSTSQPRLGTFLFDGVKVQIVDDASIPYHDKSLVNSTDTVLVLVDSVDQVEKVREVLYRSRAKVLFLFSKSDLLSDADRRKLDARLKSSFRGLDVLFVSEGDAVPVVDELKRRVFSSFDVIRVFTKEPKKDRSVEPMLLKPGSTVEVFAEKILKGLSKRIRKVRVWGPSSKFGGQSVGVSHVLSDMDTVELQTS